MFDTTYVYCLSHAHLDKESRKLGNLERDLFGHYGARNWGVATVFRDNAKLSWSSFLVAGFWPWSIELKSYLAFFGFL